MVILNFERYIIDKLRDYKGWKGGGGVPTLREKLLKD